MHPDAQPQRTEAMDRNYPLMSSSAAEVTETGDPLSAAMVRVANGDHAAFAHVYDATSRSVYALALRMMRDAAAAEEVAAEVYLHAWRRAADFDATRGRVVTWLLVIGRSRALDALRTAAAVRAGERALSRTAEEDRFQADPCDLLLATRDSSRIHHCLAALSPIQRQLLALAFFRGYSHAEIANHARIPLGTVKSHLRRALATLGENLVEGNDA